MRGSSMQVFRGGTGTWGDRYRAAYASRDSFRGELSTRERKAFVMMDTMAFSAWLVDFFFIFYFWFRCGVGDFTATWVL